MLLRIDATTYENVLPLVLNNDKVTCIVMANSGTFMARIDEEDSELLHPINAMADIFTAVPREALNFYSFQATNTEEYTALQQRMENCRLEDEGDEEKKAVFRMGWEVTNFGDSSNYETIDVTVFGKTSKLTLLDGDIYHIKPTDGAELYFQNITKSDYDNNPTALILPLVLPYEKFNYLGLRSLEAITAHIVKVMEELGEPPVAFA